MASKIRPRGREQVRSALVESSVELFAERAPHQVTVRDIAEHANVNQALVHEYFGSKEELIKATVRHLAGVRSELLQGASDAAEAMPLMFRFQRQYPAFARLIASWLLDGRDIAELDLESQDVVEGEARNAARVAQHVGREVAPTALPQPIHQLWTSWRRRDLPRVDGAPQLNVPAQHEIRIR